MVKTQKKCKFCGKSRVTYSTEQKGDVWTSKTICENCGRVVKIHTLKDEEC